LEKIEYIDEMGRTRTGTRKEARQAEAAKREEPVEASNPAGANSSYAEVL
jgi:hypothetical protein